VGVRVLDGGLQRRPPGGAEALEARQLRLDDDARRSGCVDDGGAMRGDRRGGALRRRAVRGRRRGGLRPQAGRVGIQSEDDLGLALRDEGSQPVCEMPTGRDPGMLRAAGGQRLVVDGLLQARAGRETRDLRGLDLDRLTRTWVHALTRTALGDMELAEPGERHIAAALQRFLDGVEDGVHCLAGLGLAQVRATGDLIDEL
jgi:hypothetical protein